MKNISDMLDEVSPIENDIMDVLLEALEPGDIFEKSSKILAEIARMKHYRSIRDTFPGLIQGYLIAVTTANILSKNPDFRIEEVICGEKTRGKLADILGKIDFSKVIASADDC